MKTHYEVFDVTPDSTQSEIRARYHALKGVYDDELATYGLLQAEDRQSILTEIEAAWEILGDPHARSEYDRKLRDIGHPGPWTEPDPPTELAEPDAGTVTVPDPVDSPGSVDRGIAPEPSVAVKTVIQTAMVPDPETAEPTQGVLEPPEPAPGMMNGQYLQTVREMRGVELEELSEALKITVTQLENLEHHRFERLPAPVYLRGFLRSYAQFMGLDADILVHDYLKLLENSEDG